MSGPRVAVIASAALIIAIPVATFAAISKRRPLNLSPEQTTVQYRTEAASLTLAPGWKWPEFPIPDSAPDGNRIMYENGWGKQAADFYWFCSWVSLAADQQLPATERQQALEQVLSIRTKYYYTTSLASESKPYFNQMLQKAADGDLQGVGRICEGNP